MCPGGRSPGLGRPLRALLPGRRALPPSDAPGRRRCPRSGSGDLRTSAGWARQLRRASGIPRVAGRHRLQRRPQSSARQGPQRPRAGALRRLSRSLAGPDRPRGAAHPLTGREGGLVRLGPTPGLPAERLPPALSRRALPRGGGCRRGRHRDEHGGPCPPSEAPHAARARARRLVRARRRGALTPRSVRCRRRGLRSMPPATHAPSDRNRRASLATGHLESATAPSFRAAAVALDASGS